MYVCRNRGSLLPCFTWRQDHGGRDTRKSSTLSLRLGEMEQPSSSERQAHGLEPLSKPLKLQFSSTVLSGINILDPTPIWQFISAINSPGTWYCSSNIPTYMVLLLFSPTGGCTLIGFLAQPTHIVIWFWPQWAYIVKTYRRGPPLPWSFQMERP